MIRHWWVIGLLVVALTGAGCDADLATPTRVPSGPAAPTSASLGARATRTAESNGKPTAQSPASTTATGQMARVERVVDGDTIIVRIDGRSERLRYIGIDTPETVRPNSPVECFGPEASEENKRLVDGREVELVRDISDRDRFGRLLRYVYVRDLDTGERIFVNLRLVEAGYATVSTFPPDVAHVDEFRAGERAAREEGRGLWGSCPVR